MSSGDKQVKIRIPHHVVEALKQIASANRRSTTQQIAIALEQYVATYKPVHRS